MGNSQARKQLLADMIRRSQAQAHTSFHFLAMVWPLENSLIEGILKQKQFVDSHLSKSERPAADYRVKTAAQMSSSILSMVLYVCSVNADISGTPVRPKSVKTKRGARWFPPGKPTVWEVGYREGPILGRALRLASTRDGLASSGVRPHVRRAHYHHYWVGSGVYRKSELRWLPPIFVNVDNPNDLAMKIRPVL